LSNFSIITCVGEVFGWEFVVLNSDTSLKDVSGDVTSEGNVAGDFVTSSNTERSDGESALAEDWLLLTASKVLWN